MRLVFLVLLVLFAGGMEYQALSAPACPIERGDVKTLSDPAAANLKTTPVSATVESLRALPVPGPLALHTPRFPQELQVYTVTAMLKGAKLEADSDFHVVIAGTSGATMIAEFPDPACVSHRLYRPQIATARQAFVQRFGTPPSTHFVMLKGQATLTGVLFYDTCHGQRGRAPNCAEIHPVLDLK